MPAIAFRPSPVQGLLRLTVALKSRTHSDRRPNQGTFANGWRWVSFWREGDVVWRNSHH